MRLKSFIISVSLLVAGSGSVGTWACGGDSWEPGMADYFTLVQPLDPDHTGVDDVGESAAFWCDYLNGALSKETLEEAIEDARAEDYNNPAESSNALVAALFKRGDNAALAYLRLNNRLYSLNNWMNNWDYERPNANQYNELLREIDKLRPNDKLAQRTAYLKMRALFCARNYDAVEQLWKQTASRWSEGPMKRRARGYMGGVYYQRGQYAEALEIFDANGDERSVNKCVSRLLNPTKLEEYYEQKPNSRVLGYVIQDYANYLYHAMQNDGDYGEIWPQVRRDYRQMLALAERVVKEKKVKDLGLWQDFVGFLYFAAKDDTKAYAAFDKALSLKCKPVERDFASYFKFICSFGSSERPSPYADYVLENTKRVMDYCNTNDYGESDPTYDFLYQVRDFVMPTRLYSYCQQQGLTFAAQVVANLFGTIYDEKGNFLLNWSEATNHQMKADELINYYDNMQNPPADKLTSGLAAMLDREQMPQMRELIGTKLMREGDYERAITYLQDVPQELLRSQGIAPYLNLRKPSARDFERSDYSYMEDREVSTYRNVKLDFCKDVAARMRQLLSLSGNHLADAAYQLANKIFQASPAGDRWALTEYSWSSSDTHYNGMNQQAIDLLHLAIRNTKDMQRLKKCYYGLAAVPQRETIKYYYNWQTRTYTFNLHGSELEGYEWLANNLLRTDELRRSCDWINAYINSKKKN